MKGYLKNLPQNLQEIVHLASSIAIKLNTKAYLVGGCVRDLILGVKNLDLDIVVEDDGIGFAEELKKCFDSRITMHKRFGTATIKSAEGFKVDISTARRESYPAAACLPVVEPGNLKEDLARRDFTINTMAIDITGKNPGNFIDFFNGIGDLRKKNIRVLHDLSFIDDPTRMLRAIRFEQRYDFAIEPHTLNLLKNSARAEMHKKVSAHRISDELVLILKEVKPIKYIKRIRQLIGFNFIAEGLDLDKKVFRLFSDTQKQINWFKKICPRRRHLDTWLMFFMALLDRLKLKDAQIICEKFSLNQGDRKRILSFKKIGDSFISKLGSKNISPAQIFALLEPLSYEVILLLRAKQKNKNFSKHTQDFLAIYNDIRISICGDDLKNLGLSPGPIYRKIFSRVLNAKLNGTIKTRGQEIRLIKNIISRV